MSKGESELSLREERELLLQQEVQDLAATRDELETEVADNTRRLAAELQPQIDTLEAAVEEARGELNRHKAALKKLDAERAEAAKRAQELRGSKTDIEVQKAQMAAQLSKVGAPPPPPPAPSATATANSHSHSHSHSHSLSLSFSRSRSPSSPRTPTRRSRRSLTR